MPAHPTLRQARSRHIDRQGPTAYLPGLVTGGQRPVPTFGNGKMKVVNSLKTAKLREKGCRVVRRRGRVYVINKRNPRFKARQG